MHANFPVSKARNAAERTNMAYLVRRFKQEVKQQLRLPLRLVVLQTASENLTGGPSAIYGNGATCYATSQVGSQVYNQLRHFLRLQESLDSHGF